MQKRYTLPKTVQEAIKSRTELQRRHQTNVERGNVDFEVHKQLKKQNKYCNKMIKKQSKKIPEKILQM